MTSTNPHLQLPKCFFENGHIPQGGTPGVLSAILGRCPREPLRGPKESKRFTLTSAQDPLWQRDRRLSSMDGRESLGTVLASQKLKDTKKTKPLFREDERGAARNPANNNVEKVSNSIWGSSCVCVLRRMCSRTECVKVRRVSPGQRRRHVEACPGEQGILLKAVSLGPQPRTFSGTASHSSRSSESVSQPPPPGHSGLAQGGTCDPGTQILSLG